MTIVTYTPYASVSLGGNLLDPGTIRKARVESSFSDPASRAYVQVYPEPSWSQGDAISVAIGNGSNNVFCFNGTVLQADYLNSGPTFELIARGPLWAAQKFRNNAPKGRTLQDLTGGPATDEDIATAILNVCGVSNLASIGGTGIVRGASAPDDYTWHRGESGLEYLARLTKASIGYKMVESTDGGVYRVQVLSGIGGAGDITLTQGMDIFEGSHTQIQTFDSYEAWDVTGFDYGDGLGPVYNRYPDPVPDGSNAYAWSSRMIERGPDSDSRSGISAETVVGYLRGETDHPITHVVGLSTPRDDLLGPGGRATVNAAMLGLNGTYTITGVVREVDDQWFTQTLELSG